MKYFKVGDLVITNAIYHFSFIDIGEWKGGIIPSGTILTIIEIDDSKIDWSSKKITFLFKDNLCYIMSTEFPLAMQWNGLHFFKTDEGK